MDARGATPGRTNASALKRGWPGHDDPLAVGAGRHEIGPYATSGTRLRAEAEIEVVEAGVCGVRRGVDRAVLGLVEQEGVVMDPGRSLVSGRAIRLAFACRRGDRAARKECRASRRSCGGR